MARKKRLDIGEELKKIEREERAIESEERQIEQKEDIIRAFEELGLMRWKSYYVLTAGAILLLALTFVTALWLMHGQLEDLQTSVDGLAVEMAVVESKIGSVVAAPARDWCPESQTISLNMGALGGDTEIEIMGKELREGKELCHGIITTDTGEGPQVVEMWWDEAGNVEMS